MTRYARLVAENWSVLYRQYLLLLRILEEGDMKIAEFRMKHDRMETAFNALKVYFKDAERDFL